MLRFTTSHLPIAAAALAAVAPSLASAQVPLDDLHVDIGFAFEEGVIEPHWHDEETPAEYAPGEAYGVVDLSDGLSRPAGAQWDFLGVPAGSTVYVLQQNQVAGQLFLGLGAEEIAFGTFDGPLTISLIGFSGPAGSAFSLWQTDTFGSPVPSWTTADGLGALDSLALGEGAHAHYNWGFTLPGIYTLTIEAVGEISGVPVSGSGDFQFGVGVAVPEPATWTALAAGAALAAAAIRRRRG